MKPDKNRPFLDYYGKNAIIPVHQNLSDLNAHINRRNALYYRLNLIPAWIKDKKVIEFGPGTGDNAVHTSVLGPSRYVLVDGNLKSIKEINKKKSKKRIYAKSLQVIYCDANHFKTSEKFDLVICEGIVPGQINPANFLRKIASHAQQNGIIITTTISPSSCYAEICRRVLSCLLTKNIKKFEEKTKYLSLFFEKDLKGLPGKKRKTASWVQDSLLHDWGDNPFFSIPNSITALKKKFSFLGSCPNYIRDSRWYKCMDFFGYGFNEIALSQYSSLEPLLIDYRYSFQEVEGIRPLNGSKINSICMKGYKISQKIFRGECSKRLIFQFINNVRKLRKALPAKYVLTKQSLLNYENEVTKFLACGEECKHLKLSKFRPFFGRGQQYVSFIKLVK